MIRVGLQTARSTLMSSAVPSVTLRASPLASSVARAVASTASRAAPLPAYGQLVRPAVPKSIIPGSRGFAGSVAETATALEQQYAAPLRYLHWLIAGGTIGAFATVQLAMNSPKENMKDKMNYMMLHKSLGLTVLGLTAPRLLLRLTTKIPPAVPGSFIEQTAATAGHALMYVFLIGMPATGFMMGYFGGKGLPFFGMVIPGAEKRDGKLAGQAFKIHKQMGYYYELFVPLHIGAVGIHALKGQNIMRRMGVTAFG